MTTNLVDPSKSTKLIELDIGYDIVLPITINSDTGLLYEISETVGFGSQPSVQSLPGQELKLNELFPKATDVALSFYVYFLRGKELTVVTRSDLTDCLNLYSLTGDTNFFETLLKSLFKLWTVLSPVLYNNKVTEEIKWEVWLRCPFQLLPDVWLRNKPFMSTWRQREDNKYLRLNGDEIFDFQEGIITELFDEDEDEHEDEHEDEDEGEQQQTQSRHRHFKTVNSTYYTRENDNTRLLNSSAQEMYDDEVVSTTINTSYNDVLYGEEIYVELTNPVYKTRSVEVRGEQNGPLKFYADDELAREVYKLDG